MGGVGDISNSSLLGEAAQRPCVAPYPPRAVFGEYRLVTIVGRSAARRACSNAGYLLHAGRCGRRLARRRRKFSAAVQPANWRVGCLVFWLKWMAGGVRSTAVLRKMARSLPPEFTGGFSDLQPAAHGYLTADARVYSPRCHGDEAPLLPAAVFTCRRFRCYRLLGGRPPRPAFAVGRTAELHGVLLHLLLLLLPTASGGGNSGDAIVQCRA